MDLRQGQAFVEHRRRNVVTLKAGNVNGRVVQVVMVEVVKSRVVVHGVAWHHHQARLRSVHGQPPLPGRPVQPVVVPDVVLSGRTFKVQPR